MKLEPNCVGRFQIAVIALESGWLDIANALPTMLVLKVEPNHDGTILTYTAVSRCFDTLNEGEEVPMYRLNFSTIYGVICFEGAERIIVGRGMV